MNQRKLTHFSPATGSAVPLPHAPAAWVTQDNTETQKDDTSIRVAPAAQPSGLRIGVCVKASTSVWHTRRNTRQDVAKEQTCERNRKKAPTFYTSQVCAWRKTRYIRLVLTPVLYPYCGSFCYSIWSTCLYKGHLSIQYFSPSVSFFAFCKHERFIGSNANINANFIILPDFSCFDYFCYLQDIKRGSS